MIATSFVAIDQDDKTPVFTYASSPGLGFWRSGASEQTHQGNLRITGTLLVGGVPITGGGAATIDPSGGEGAVLVEGAAGALTSDAGLTWDAIKKVVLVGPGPFLASQTEGLAIQNPTSNAELTLRATDTNSGTIRSIGGHGTLETPTASLVDETLFDLVAAGYGSDDVLKNSAEITVEVDVAPGAAIVPGRLLFFTSNGAGDMTERLRLDSAGLITLTGTPKFAGENSTGAGSGVIGAANCPAVDPTAVFTWATVQAADGSTCYVPLWK